MTLLAIHNGCDLEMPKGAPMSPRAVSAALQAHDLSQPEVDDAVRRVIRTIIRVGLMDKPRDRDGSLIDCPEHQRLALETAEKGMVLLKNEQSVLPLDPAQVHSIALIGPACKLWEMSIEGSGKVVSTHSVSPFDAISSRAGRSIKISYSRGWDEWYSGEAVPSSALQPAAGEGQGLTGEYFGGDDFQGPRLASRLDGDVDFDFSKDEQRPAGVPARHFCARWTGWLTAPATGTYRMNIDASAGARLFVDGKILQDTWPGFDGSAMDGKIDLAAGRRYAVKIEYVGLGGGPHLRWTWLPPGGALFAEQVEMARKADVAIVFVGSGGEGEYADRRSMALPGVQEEMIKAVAAANPKTIVVLNNGGPVLVSDWIGGVQGVIEAYLPGEAGGAALARILFGDAGPSGKLVYTMGQRRQDYPDFRRYPIDLHTLVLSGSSKPAVDYAEGIYVGYRHFDKEAILPSFPFGFGLSYTSFKYTDMRLSEAAMTPAGKAAVTVDITNAGGRAGAEIVQLYVRANQPRVDRPVRELKGFARVELKPGEKKTVAFGLTARDFAYYDVPGKQWRADAGSYTVEIGASSRDIRATATMALRDEYILPIAFLGKLP